MKKFITIIFLLSLIFSQNLQEQEDCGECVCEELPIDVWIRPSNDEKNFKKFIVNWCVNTCFSWEQIYIKTNPKRYRKNEGNN